MTTRNLAVLLALAVPVAAQGGDDADKKKSDKPAAVEIGQAVPADLAFTDLEGQSHTFGDLRGKVVFVHFWSITCPWERLAEPKIASIEADYDKEKVVVLAINANQNEIGAMPAADAFAKKGDDRPYGKVRGTLKKKELDFKVMLDHDNVVSTKLAARATPHCFVIDTKGVLRYAGALDDNGRSEKAETEYVRNAIDAVLAGGEVEVKSSRPYG